MPYLGKSSFIVAPTMLLLSMPVYADIVSTTGSIHLQDPAPASLWNGQHVSSDSISLIQELQGVSLLDDLSINILNSGFYNAYGDITKGDAIAAGTEVDSWLLHLDRYDDRDDDDDDDDRDDDDDDDRDDDDDDDRDDDDDDDDDFTMDGDNNSLSLLASVTFDTEVLGLIIFGSELEDSDGILGLPSTEYGGDWRGLEFNSLIDWIELSEDRRTVSVKFNVCNYIDQVRIVTALPAHAVPAHGAIALLGFAGIAVRRRRRTHNH